MIGILNAQRRTQLNSLFDQWHRFWLTPADPIVPSFLRILAGGMLFYTILVWGRNLEAFFLQDGGWQSAALVSQLQQGEWTWSFWWLVPDSMLWPVHLTCLAIVFCYWIGLGTALTKWFSFAILVSYANRVPLANYGLDQANAMLTLYLCLGPCGARFSVDRLLAKTFFSSGNSTKVEASAAAGLSMRMIHVHLCVIYFFAGLSKLQGMAWWDGSAVWMAASNYEYQQFSLTWLADFPWIYQSATVGTWIWEISFPFLIWNRFARPWMLLIGLSMHLGIGMFMGMWTFGLIMCFAYASFLPASLLHDAVDFLSGRSRSSRRAAPVTPDYWKESIHGDEESGDSQEEESQFALPARESSLNEERASASGQREDMHIGNRR